MLLLLGASTWASGPPSWPTMREDADKGLPPWIQYYNRLKGEPKLGPFDQHLSEPESLNVRLVGKWGRGPAARVTGRGSLAYVSLGSEVAIFNVSDGHNPIIVNEIQCRYVVDRAILKDSLLYCVLQGGIEVFNIANPTNVTRIRYFPISAVDMCIQDSLAYTISADSFTVYQLVSPDSILKLGACADSGYYVAADSGFAYLCDRWGLYVIDATDPTNPHQATVLTGAQTGAVWVDSGYCYYTTASASPNSFRIADVSDPYHPAGLGYIDGIASYDLFKLSFFMYLPGYYIVDVTNPNFPTRAGSTTCDGNGVWTRSPFSFSFVASAQEGMSAVNVNDPVNPHVDTVVAGAFEAFDVFTDAGMTYVADDWSGMKILNTAVPANPLQIGSYDTVGQAPRAQAVSVRDSLADLMTYWWGPTDFRVVDVSQPENPRLVATAQVWGPGRAIVTRDSLAYVAEDYQLEIFSIANPRSPRLVGSCGLPNSSYGLCLRDTLAFVGNLTSLRIVNVTNPASPVVIGSLSMRALGVSVMDTIALVGGMSELFAVSVANPISPYLISTFPLFPEGCWTVQLDGVLAYIGTGGSSNTSKLRVMDISRPDSMRCIGYHFAPTGVRQIRLQNGLAYAACFDAGVCIYETTSTTSVSEANPASPRPQAFELTPNPASSFVDIRLEVNQSTKMTNTVRLYDAAGRVVLDVPIVLDRGKQPRPQRVDLSTLPDGCYFVAVEPSGQDRVQKVIKFGRRR
jgi:hypothetical protein